MLEYEVNTSMDWEKLCCVEYPQGSGTHWSLLDFDKHYLVCVTSWEKAPGYGEFSESLSLKWWCLGGSYEKIRYTKKKETMINPNKKQRIPWDWRASSPVKIVHYLVRAHACFPEPILQYSQLHVTVDPWDPPVFGLLRYILPSPIHIWRHIILKVYIYIYIKTKLILKYFLKAN